MGNIPGDGVAIFGHAFSPSAQGYGIEGISDSTMGVGLVGFATATSGYTYGLKGYVSSISGTGVRGLSTATHGSTVGVSASVASPTGIAAVFNNGAGGKILSGQNNGAEKFSVDGNGNVNALGTFTGSGAGLTGILFSNLSGSLGSSQFSGTYHHAVTLSNISNVYYGDGSNLTGVVSGPGSPYYIANGTSQQPDANFNISGNGTLAGTLEATFVNSDYTYAIGGSVVLDLGYIDAFEGNLFIGVGAGVSNIPNKAGLNTYTGYQAGYHNNWGSDNSFYGYQAGYNTSGPDTPGNNTFYGYQAGFNNTTGSNDIYIGNPGPISGTESNAIRIGGPGGGTGPQTSAYIAGIYGSTATPSPPFQAVCVDQNGTLFGTTPVTSCVVSSRRFKQQIADMGDSSSRLFQLRPVTFFYKPQYDDGSHQPQYGLIAEEVAKVYPDMVAYDKDGQPYTVKYQYLAPMLLNELQKQHAVVAVQQDVIKAQQGQIESLQTQNLEFQQRLSRLEALIGR